MQIMLSPYIIIFLRVKSCFFFNILEQHMGLGVVVMQSTGKCRPLNKTRECCAMPMGMAFNYAMAWCLGRGMLHKTTQLTTSNSKFKFNFNFQGQGQ